MELVDARRRKPLNPTEIGLLHMADHTLSVALGTQPNMDAVVLPHLLGYSLPSGPQAVSFIVPVFVMMVFAYLHLGIVVRQKVAAVPLPLTNVEMDDIANAFIVAIYTAMLLTAHYLQTVWKRKARVRLRIF